MRTQSIGKYIMFTTIGFLLFAAGVTMIVLFQDSAGVMKTLPFICIGVGCGVFGGNLGSAVKLHLLRKGSPAAKQAEIEEKDERSTAIREKAKAKSYDMMVMVFGALMLGFVLAQADLYVILAFVAAYLFVTATNVYYICKFNKQM